MDKVRKPDRVELHYFDDDGITVPKDQATRVIIRELDDAGQLLRETYGFVGGDDRE